LKTPVQGAAGAAARRPTRPPHALRRITALIVGLAMPFLLAASLPLFAAQSPSFRRDIVPLLKQHCAACHLTGEEPGNMALYPDAAYKTLVGVPSTESPLLRVKPKDPDASYMVSKLEGTQLEAGGKGARMPLDGGYLSAEDIQRIRDWISRGAPND
jgi:mono/diheme cytochrome c family protein